MPGKNGFGNPTRERLQRAFITAIEQMRNNADRINSLTGELLAVRNTVADHVTNLPLEFDPDDLVEIDQLKNVAVALFNASNNFLAATSHFVEDTE